MIKLRALAIVNQLHNKFGPNNIKEVSRTLECLNNTDEVHAHAHAENKTKSAYFVCATNNHKEHNNKEDRQNVLAIVCDSVKLTRMIPETLKLTKMMPQIEKAPFLGCMDGLYSCFCTPTTDDNIMVKHVPAMIIKPSPSICILRTKKKFYINVEISIEI